MWQTDILTIQQGTTVTEGSGKYTTWADNYTVICDVQEINRDEVLKKYGFDYPGEYLQVFDRTLDSGWVKNNQVKYDGRQWWVRRVNGNMAKMGGSNHIYIILNEVV